MEKERKETALETEPAQGIEHFKDRNEYAAELLTRSVTDNADGVKRLLLQRGDFGKNKLLGEDEVWDWMQEYKREHPDCYFPFEFSEKKVIVPRKREWKSPEDYWAEVTELAGDDCVEGVQDLLLRSGNIKLSDIKGQEDLFAWLRGRAENKPNVRLEVELNEEGIIVPIKSEEK